MKEFTYTIGDPNGMHARPAGKLAACAKQFGADVRVCANEKEADGKRLLALMTLGATHGTTLTFRVNGTDEDLACAELESFCKNHLNGEQPS